MPTNPAMKVLLCLTRYDCKRHNPSMLEYRQIRAARALLGWSQSDLAKAAAMATSSIKNIENQCSTARRETLSLIRSAFEDNGIEFLPGAGVRLRNDVVEIVQGHGATATLLDSIFKTAHLSPSREVLIIGLDEKFSLDTDGNPLLSAHIARLQQAGIRERILIREGDTNFLNEPSCYRWLPLLYFTRSAPLYIYGDTVAVHTGSLQRQTTIIRNRAHAQNLRHLFEALWALAAVPSDTRSVPLRLAGGACR